MVGTLKRGKALNQYIVISAVICALIAVVGLFHIRSLNMPYIFNDEFGYWASAAYFAGYDWSEVIREAPYYAYGYGLLLSPILMLFKNPALCYKVAIALNVVYLWASYFILSALAARMFGEAKQSIRLVAAGAVTLFSANVLQVNYTWPEVFLFFLFCAISLLLYDFIQKPTILRGIAVTALAVYNYAVHQRTVGILISVGMIIFLLLLQGKISIKHILCIAAVFAILFVAHSFIKQMIIGSVWENSPAVEKNDYSGQYEKVTSLFSMDGLISIGTSVLGKLFTIVISSFLVILLALETQFGTLLKNFKDVFVKRTLKHIDAINLFFVLVFASSLLISAIFMVRPSGITYLVYGRYTDNILGPYLLIGVLYLILGEKTSLKRVAAYGCIVTAIAFAVRFAVNYFGIIYRETTVNNAGISIFFNGTQIETWKASFVALMVFAVLSLVVRLPLRRLGAYAACVVLAVIWIYISSYGYKIFSSSDWNTAFRSLERVADTINYIEETNGVKLNLYCIRTDGYQTEHYGNALQYLYPDRYIEYLYHYELDSLDVQQAFDENAFVIIPSKVDRIRGMRSMGKYGVYNAYMADGVEYTLAYETVALAVPVTGDGEEGYVHQERHWGFADGKYEATVQYTLPEGYENGAAVFELVRIDEEEEETVLVSQPLVAGAGEATIEVFLASVETLESRVWTQAGTAFELESIELLQLSSETLLGSVNNEQLFAALDFVDSLNSNWPVYYTTLVKNSTIRFDSLQEAYPNISVSHLLYNNRHEVEEASYLLLQRKAVDVFDLAQEYDLVYFNTQYEVYVAKNSVDEQSVLDAGGYIYTNGGVVDARYYSLNSNGMYYASVTPTLQFGTYRVRLYIEGDEAAVRGSQIVFSYTDAEQWQSVIYDTASGSGYAEAIVPIQYRDRYNLYTALVCETIGQLHIADMEIERIDDSYLWSKSYADGLEEKERMLFRALPTYHYQNTDLPFAALQRGEYTVSVTLAAYNNSLYDSVNGYVRVGNETEEYFYLALDGYPMLSKETLNFTFELSRDLPMAGDTLLEIFLEEGLDLEVLDVKIELAINR